MKTATSKPPVLLETLPGKIYGSSALRAARHFLSVDCAISTLALADALQARPEVLVVAVLDEAGRPLGLIERERLFALLGKPFGREVLGRTTVSELVQEAPLVDRHTGLFSLAGSGCEDEAPFRILVDESGAFQAILSARDLSDYLSRITQDDIELAGQIQERLEECNENPSDERFAFEAWTRAAKGVGGDFWHTRNLDDGRLFLALCDVSGKGLSASLVVSMVWGMLLMCDPGKGLYPLLRDLNDSIVSTFRLERYLTGFFALYDPVTGELEAADMGHSHALVFSQGKIKRLKSGAGNLPVGVDRGLEPRTERWILAEGDGLLVYSDGLTEQEDGQGREYGEGRLAAATAAALGRGARLRDAIPRALDAWRGRIPQQDDMSFLFLERTPRA